MSVSSDQVFVQHVLNHYTRHGRHTLPWRLQVHPYRVLVSELMLQQTQVSRVIEKFNMWMKQYPSLTSLSKASLTDILILWQGLGYQRRAKALYEISHRVTRIPKTFESLCALPGVGPYTASAVCAFAYNNFTLPVLETNIRTALIERFHKHMSNVADTLLYDDLRRLESLPSVANVGACVWYSALMDYGAYLKAHKISHNIKVKGYTNQSKYKGSLRELRAKTLFAIIHKTKYPDDARTQQVLDALLQEGFIQKIGKQYQVR